MVQSDDDGASDSPPGAATTLAPPLSPLVPPWGRCHTGRPPLAPLTRRAEWFADGSGATFSAHRQLAAQRALGGHAYLLGGGSVGSVGSVSVQGCGCARNEKMGGIINPSSMHSAASGLAWLFLSQSQPATSQLSCFYPKPATAQPGLTCRYFCTTLMAAGTTEFCRYLVASAQGRAWCGQGFKSQPGWRGWLPGAREGRLKYTRAVPPLT